MDVGAERGGQYHHASGFEQAVVFIERVGGFGHVLQHFAAEDGVMIALPCVPTSPKPFHNTNFGRGFYVVQQRYFYIASHSPLVVDEIESASYHTEQRDWFQAYAPELHIPPPSIFNLKHATRVPTSAKILATSITSASICCALLSPLYSEVPLSKRLNVVFRFDPPRAAL